MGYASWSVVFGEQPSAAKWNTLGTNDASFNDGTGIANAAITASKLSTGASSASVLSAQTTTSTSFTDLATAGPAVTVTIGANGLALVILSAELANNTAGDYAVMGFAASGANTIAASADRALFSQGTNDLGHSWAYLATGLTAGSTTFTAKYEVITGGTATIGRRYISVIPL